MIFLNGNIDVVTRILGFVAESSEELNTCAMISQVFRLSRSDPRFDQTRTGTIILKTSYEDIPPEVWQRWDQQVFTGNRVRLVAILTQLPRRIFTNSPRNLPFALANVREVILRRDASVKIPKSFAACKDAGGVKAVRFFRTLLPNLDILDIGALAVTTNDLVGPLNFSGPLFASRVSVFRCYAEVVYPGCNFCLLQPDNNGTNNLREIHIDPFGLYFLVEFPTIIAYCKEYNQLRREYWFDSASYSNNGADWVLLREYTNLERVTLKNATYLERYGRRSGNSYWKKLPQEALIKFVRHTPKLRWFCSDLTQDNIAILKEERPEVEFCN
jgi:hypothetical protein